MTLDKLITFMYSDSTWAKRLFFSLGLLVLNISLSFFFILKIDLKVNSLLKTLENNYQSS